LSDHRYPEPRMVLFLCTGNFFRSPFAERYFNHLGQGGAWVATSRGLSVQALTARQRFLGLSPFTTERLRRLGIPGDPGPDGASPEHTPTAIGLQDLEGAHRIIAVQGSIHRPMLEAFLGQHPRRTPLLARVECWEIEDLPAGADHLVREIAARSTLDRLQTATERMLRDL